MRYKQALVAFIVAAACAVAAPAAQAHFIITQAAARDKVASIYRSHCGNGLLWKCTSWWEFAWTSYVGSHSVQVDLGWKEGTIYDDRTCRVVARVEHDYVAQIITPEYCYG